MPWKLYIGFQYSKTYFTQHLRKNETEFLLQNTVLYSVFTAPFIAVGYIAAQAWISAESQNND